MRSFALAACSVCSVAALDSRALAAMDFSQLAAATELENAADPVPSMDMPAQFSAGIILSQTSDLYNQTFTGKIWGSSPSKQQRLSGTQFISVGSRTVTQGVTYIEDGSRGMKYTFTPDPNANDPSVPGVLCKSQAMSATELARYGSSASNPTKFAGNVFLDDRVTTAFIDTSVPPPGLSAIFLDPFRAVPAGMVTKGPRGINNTVVIYEDLAATEIKPTEFAVPQGISCTPGDVMSISAYSAWQW